MEPREMKRQSMFAGLLLAFIVILVTAALRADAQDVDRPKSRADIIEAAKSEKRLVVYSTVHADAAVEDLLADFRRLYPFITVENSDDDAARTYQRFTREVAAGKPSADFIWSSAMDLQEKLINDGYAMAYASPEMPFLPSWAHWQDLGYGVTLEPIAFVYNRRFLTDAQMPHTHEGLRDLLRQNPELFRDRVAIYNPEKSEVGMLVLSQDIRATRDSWTLFDTFGRLNAHNFSTTRDMIAHIVSGDQWIGYDLIASYALEMQKHHPELVIVFPTDYVLTMSRVAFIAASSRHPNAAKLFLDFLLSRAGQKDLKSHGMGSVRADIGVPREQPRLSSVRTQAIRIGPGLLSDLDSLVRAQFLRRWSQSRAGRF